MIKTRARGTRAAAIAVIGFFIAGMSVTTASATPVKTNVVKTPVVHATVAPKCVAHDAVEYQAAVAPTYETVPNPNYVPAVPEQSHMEKVVDSPAVPEQSHMEKVVDSPAVAEVSHWEWKYAEHGGNGFIWVDNHTYKYMTEAGQGYDHWWDIPWHTRFYERTEHKHKVIDVKGQKEQSHMEKVVDSPAVPEKSHMEKVIDVVGSPAIGEPTMQKMTDPGKPEVKGSPATYCEWYTWDTGSYTPNATGASDVHWPQTLVGAGKIAPTTCGLTYQQDLYGGTRAQIDAVIGDGVLTGNPPEDSAIVKDWHFASSDKCPEITRVEVQPTVTTTDVCGPDNATLVGNAQVGVVWSAVTTSEDGTMSITASPAAGYSFPDSFKTTFTMKDSGEACIIPVEVQPTVTTTDVCGPDNATLVGNAQVGVVWSAVTTSEDGTMSITASPAAGYSFPDSFKTTFTMKDSGEACIIPVEVQPTVTTTDVCGPDNATLVVTLRSASNGPQSPQARTAP